MLKDHACVVALSLGLVVFAEEQSSGLTKSAKIIVHLSASPSPKEPGPMQSSNFNYVRFSFRDGGQTGQSAGRPRATGIAGIEHKMQKRAKETEQDISVAFTDMKRLMEKAGEMVRLSKNISDKIKEKQGEITDDETVQFKAYLLSLGVSDPVTRESHGTGQRYFVELAQQLAKILEPQLLDGDGVMTLTDVYCRVNRARGLELLSPDDLLNACKLLEPLKLPIIMKQFDSGVKVVQLLSHSEKETVAQTAQITEEKGFVTGDQLSTLLGISVVLANERLVAAEKVGALCRDESAEGLKFYTNRFLLEST